MAKLLLIGGGGHCRVVIDALRAAGGPEPDGIVDLPECVGGRVEGVPVIGTDSDLARLRTEGFSAAHVTVGSVGVADVRARLFSAAKDAGFELAAIVHPAATVSASATLGPGAFVAAGAVVGPGARVGANCIVNTGAVVDHDCVLGDSVHVAPGATLSGDVAVGERSLVGTGASVVQGVTIGAGTVIGAGSAVVDDIGDGVLAYGVPCTEVRDA
jgi:sugar O-acyltransferase (sialic acid O-acetyltransferase NeuD family)